MAQPPSGGQAPPGSQQEGRPEAGRSRPGRELGVGWQKQRKRNTGSRGSEGLRASAPGLIQRVGCMRSDVSPLVLRSARPQFPLTTGSCQVQPVRARHEALHLCCRSEAPDAACVTSVVPAPAVPPLRRRPQLMGQACCVSSSASGPSSAHISPSHCPSHPTRAEALAAAVLWDPHHHLLFQGFPHFYTYFLCSVPSAESFRRCGPSQQSD